jgi:hypothetical protein
MKLRSLVPNFCIHVSVSDLYMSTIGLHILLYFLYGPIVGIYKSLTCKNLEQGHAVSFLGIFVSNFRYICSVQDGAFPYQSDLNQI